MTTEIAVLNRLGIALASDSAVTISGGSSEKVFDSADKLFELSPVYPIAIMINGNMDCLGVPWEIIVKDFREELGNRPRKTIENWMADFLDYTSKYKFLSQIKSDEIIKSKIDGFCSAIKAETATDLFDSIRYGERRDVKNQEDFQRVTKAYLLDLINSWQEVYNDLEIADSLQNIKPSDVCTSYEILSDEYLKQEFKPHTLSPEECEALRRLFVNKILVSETTDYTTGLVIAGYGADSIFPAVESAEVEAKVLNVLKYSKIKSYSIDDAEDADRVVSYAQTDVIERLLGGADPIFVEKSASYIKEAIIEASSAIESAFRTRRISSRKEAERVAMIEEIGIAYEEKYKDEAARELTKEFTDEFDRMIALTPKQELINLAEALVNITAVERKASSDQGTVGGAIDVALITKHEGFVWIKRKQHFDPNLNPRYFWRRYGRSMAGGSYGTSTGWAEALSQGAQDVTLQRNRDGSKT